MVVSAAQRNLEARCTSSLLARLFVNVMLTERRRKCWRCRRRGASGNDGITFFAKPIIVISRFLQHPQKRSCGNQLIHRRLSKTKSIGSGSDPESQAGRQSDGYSGWCLEFRRGGR